MNFFEREKELAVKATKRPWQFLEREKCIHRTGEWEHQGNVPPKAVVCVAQGWDELGRPEPRIQIEEIDAEYIVFAVNNMSRVCELLWEAMYALNIHWNNEQDRKKKFEEIQTALEEMMGDVK